MGGKMSYVSTIRSGAEIDRRLNYVKYLESLNSQPVGIKWNTVSTNPTLTLIDISGNLLIPTAAFFSNHSIWGGIKRCLIDRTTKAITYGTGNAGSDLTLDGTEGDVFVEIPAFKYQFELIGTEIYLWILPYTPEDTDYTVHPAFNQRSNTTTAVKPKIYVSAYEASLRDDNGTLKLQSISGAQPFVGGGIVRSINFTSGGTSAIQIGEVLTGATSAATAEVVGFHLTSGSWAGGDAEGVCYIQNQTGTLEAENLNGTLAGANCMTCSGASTGLTFNITNAETYATALGTGFGALNIWTDAAIRLLLYIEYRTLSMQSQIGAGIANQTSSAYGGKKSGADSIDTRLNSAGTGTGNGVSGSTPICWRGIENPWGNIEKFLIGINSFTDGSYNILKRDGTGIPAATLASGSYESGTGVEISNDGYVSSVLTTELGLLSWITSGVVGSSTTYYCDYYYRNRSYSPSIVIAGGSWIRVTANTIGPAARDANRTTTTSASYIGTRIEYLPTAVD